MMYSRKKRVEYLKCKVKLKSIEKNDGDEFEEVQIKSNAFTTMRSYASDKQSVTCYNCGKKAI